MSLSRAILLPVGFSVLALAGCSGSGGSSGAAHVRCGGTESFCLVSCDLGCGGAGCAVTEVAENQRIQFVFNQDLAPSSIDVSSFSLRTASGEAPLGDTIVDGPRVTFVPLVSVSGGVSSFGFRRNESYIVTLLGGSQRAIRSVAGDILPQSFTCTITASGGIIDADNARPRATLIAPTNIVAAPANSTIVLRFSELIDSTPFQAPISPSTPIHYVLRQTRIPTGTTERICNPDSEAIQLEGLPVVSIEQVNGRLDALAVSLLKQYPKEYSDARIAFAVHPLLGDMVKDSQPALRAAMGGVLLLLLIAVANATALAVARLKTRERDLAVRGALGASRGALVLDVLVESVLLSVYGAIAGSALAIAGVAAVRRIIPHTVPRWEHIAVGWDLLFFSTAFALAGLVLLGLLPVWKVARGTPWMALRGGTAQGGRAEGAASRLMLVGGQIALTVVLAFGAAQLVRSAVSLAKVDLGFDPHVMVVRVPADMRKFGNLQGVVGM